MNKEEQQQEEIPEWVQHDIACRMMWVTAHIWRERAIYVREDDGEQRERLIRLAHYQCDHVLNGW